MPSECTHSSRFIAVTVCPRTYIHALYTRDPGRSVSMRARPCRPIASMVVRRVDTLECLVLRRRIADRSAQVPSNHKRDCMLLLPPQQAGGAGCYGPGIATSV